MGIAEDLDGLPSENKSPSDKLLAALKMYDDGVDLQRMNIRRQNPSFTDEQVEESLLRWLAREE